MKVKLLIKKQRAIEVIQDLLDNQVIFRAQLVVDWNRVDQKDVAAINLWASKCVKFEAWSSGLHASCGIAFKPCSPVADCETWYAEIWGDRDFLATTFFDQGKARSWLRVNGRVADYQTEHRQWRWWDTKDMGQERVSDIHTRGYANRLEALTGRKVSDCLDKTGQWFEAHGVPKEIVNWVRQHQPQTLSRKVK